MANKQAQAATIFFLQSVRKKGWNGKQNKNNLHEQILHQLYYIYIAPIEAVVVVIVW